MTTEVETVTLRDERLYGSEYPHEEECIWGYVSDADFDVPFRIVTVNPVEWVKRKNPNGETLEEIFRDHAEPWQRKVVRSYVKNAEEVRDTRLLLVAGDELVDGSHRMIAFAKKGITAAKAADLMQEVTPDESLPEPTTRGEAGARTSGDS